MIDAHVHLLDPVKYPYPTGSRGYVPGKHESGTLAGLMGEMDRHAVSCAVIVAASVYGSDNIAMLDALDTHPNRFRVIAGIDLDNSSTLTKLSETPGVAGIRLNLTSDKGQASSGKAADILDAALGLGLVVSMQASPSVMRAMVEKAGNGDIILDHLGRPDLDGGLVDLRALAQRPRTWLKLSGGFRIASDCWPAPSAIMQEVVNIFPLNRLIWGSDWPYINISGQRPRYEDCVNWGRQLTNADLAANARRLFWRAS